MGNRNRALIEIALVDRDRRHHAAERPTPAGCVGARYAPLRHGLLTVEGAIVMALRRSSIGHRALTNLQGDITEAQKLHSPAVRSRSRTIAHAIAIVALLAGACRSASAVRIAWDAPTLRQFITF